MHVTFESLLVRFLKGKGIPCPRLFANATEHFDNIVELDRIEDENFRPRMFCWAASGSPQREPDSTPIAVSTLSNISLYVMVILLSSGELRER